MTRGLGKTFVGMHAKPQGHQFHVGYVQSIQWSDTPPDLTILFSANTNAVSGIRFLSSYSPQVGDYVMATHTGSIRVQGGGDWLVLGTVGVASGWQTFSYSNSWVSGGGPAAAGTVAGYRITGNIVRLGGNIKSGANNTSPFTLAAGYRPAAQVYLTSASDVSNAPNVAQVSITTAGVANVIAASGWEVVVLDGMTFTVD